MYKRVLDIFTSRCDDLGKILNNLYGFHLLKNKQRRLYRSLSSLAIG